MATSAVETWNPAITTIINRSLRIVGAIGESETPSVDMQTDTLETANAMVKALEASGLHVWTEEEAIIFLQPGQSRYLIGGSTTDKSSAASAYTLNTLALAGATGDSSVTVTSSTGITNGQNFGVVLDNGKTFWTTVNGVPSGNLIQLAASLTSGATAGNNVFSYTTNILRPLKIPGARRLAFNGLLETPMRRMSRKEYENTPNKAASGVPTAFFYTPKLVQGELYTWPVTPDSTSALRVTWYRQIQDFANVSNTADMPQEWINALTWQLALEIGLEFDVPPIKYQMIEKRAEQMLDLVLSYDRESEDIQFGMDFEGSQG